MPINPSIIAVFDSQNSSADSHDKRRKPEPTSRLSRNLIRRRKVYLFLKISDL